MKEIEIVDKPKLKSFLRSITELSITVLVWGFWLYLFLPLLTFVLWLFGIRYFYSEIIEGAGYRELIKLWSQLGWAIVGVFLILRLWGFYNYWRFGKKNRRIGLAPNNNENTSKHFKISLKDIEDLQSRKEITWPLPVAVKQDVE